MSEYLKGKYSVMKTDMLLDDYADPRKYWIRFLFLAHKAGY